MVKRKGIKTFADIKIVGLIQIHFPSGVVGVEMRVELRTTPHKWSWQWARHRIYKMKKKEQNIQQYDWSAFSFVDVEVQLELSSFQYD